MAAEMEQQLQLHRQITRFVDNFKKVGRKNYTTSMVRSRIKSIKELWLRFDAGHAALEVIIPQSSKKSVSYYSDNFYDEAETAYNLSLDHFAEVLDEMEPPLSPIRSADMSHARISHSACSSSHLPVIQLAPFNGHENEWEHFRDRFVSVIIDNKDLTDFARMHYLATSLRGRALDCISGLAITAENFGVAWQLLKEQFDDKRRLISVHMTTLFNLPRLSRESATDLQTLLGTIKLTLASLASLERSPSDLWNDFLVHLTVQHLDPTTSRTWTFRSRESPEPHLFEELNRFVSDRVRALEDLARRSPRPERDARRSDGPRVHSANVLSQSPPTCPICHSRHYMSACSRFVSSEPNQRRALAKKHRRCFNCLSPNHSARECSSKYSCRTCHQRHHSMLHGAALSESQSGSVSSAPLTTTRVENSASSSHTLAAASRDTVRRTPVLLATARVGVRSSNGRVEDVRALLDQGSEITLITENLVQRLRARRKRTPTSISAVGCVSAGSVRHAVEISVSSLSSPFRSFDTIAVVLKALTKYIPRHVIDLAGLKHLSGLPLADPDPFASDPIDLIIGADLYGDLLGDGLRKGAPGQPIAQQTAFGWIISGPLVSPDCAGLSPHPPAIDHTRLDVVASYHCLASFDDDLKYFWEVEDVPSSPIRSPDDESCDSHFIATHSRSPTGRYIVRIPLKTDSPLEIGSSRARAAGSLSNLLRRLQHCSEQRSQYFEFLREYEALGHMSRVADTCPSRSPIVYIPHHPVFRTHSSTSGIRVVFNASSPTSNGRSLNDTIFSGPKLQADLPAVILRWRVFRFAYCADIEKMYRQILVDERDRDLQRILWSENQHVTPTDYRLMTVTYGMACAPFLALRVVQQLRVDEGDEFPLASVVLRDHIYVDDVLFGGDSIDGAIQVREQLVALLGRGCFQLRKWSSNSRELLADIPANNWGLAGSRTIASDERIRVLGVAWVPSEDSFSFSIALPDLVPQTKRTILSTIARLYDPLGWVTPVTINAKVFIQSLWRHKVGWDDILSEDLLSQWRNTYLELSRLEGIRVPRWIGFAHDVIQIELHGFADASNKAYAAVVYCKIVSSSNRININLLTGKSKVAPIKPLSVPRLELLAAVMLARLLKFVRESLRLETAPCFCWSDSTVVLTWLSHHASQWKVFVAHRVHEIQTLVPTAKWRHVPTADNPADCASRGMTGGALMGHSLWWRGPSWLVKPESDWPLTAIPRAPDATMEQKSVSTHVGHSIPTWDLLSRVSSWPRTIRVLSYILRFVSACRIDADKSSRPVYRARALTAAECSAARGFLIKSLQLILFPRELHLLSKGHLLPSNSALLSLSPFIDKEGILRVGGRISRAPLPFTVRHPILLASHRLTDLIVDHAHLRALHAGMQLTLSVLRRDFWILRARSIVRHRIHQCVVCVRERMASPSQFMSDFPLNRVSAPSRAFLHVGIDYAGPVQIRVSAGRGIRSRKAYIALFVCLATRAIHLELVSDYTSRTFLNAFSRFTARRGLPTAVYSDNGTTFIGAAKELSIAYRAAIRDPNFLNSVASDNIEWKFIPPSAPHFGGLWEAGVKSVKHHLRRVVRNYTLTIEEFSTLLCRVEACLNSRPIAPLSDSLDDFEPLTPGHFLIGAAITGHPEPSLLDIKESRLTRWQLVRHLTERFWRYWYFDYVNLLQQRSKWRTTQSQLRVGQLVLVRNSSLPPCKWELGRVIRCHPGADGRIRVATVRTANSEIMRPLVKLCLLPVAHPPTNSATASADLC